jgi:hypothetical protein
MKRSAICHNLLTLWHKRFSFLKNLLISKQILALYVLNISPNGEKFMILFTRLLLQRLWNRSPVHLKLSMRFINLQYLSSTATRLFQPHHHLCPKSGCDLFIQPTTSIIMRNVEPNLACPIEIVLADLSIVGCTVPRWGQLFCLTCTHTHTYTFRC